MALSEYTKTLTISAAPITGIAGPVPHPTSITAGGTTYAVPAAWTRWPVVGDWLVQLPNSTLIWWPALTQQDLALNPLAGPWVANDRVVCPRVTPTDVMEVVTVAPEGYYCRSIRSPTLLLMQAWDLETAP